MITHLEPHQVFVFGSNLAGKHLSGAARQAIEEFGAEWGVGEGLTGQCYAFPTLTEEFEQLSDEALEEAVGFFVYTAYVHSEYEFLLTKVGRGRYVEPDNIEFLYNDECFSILTVPGYKIWNIPAHLEEYLGKLEALRLEVERPWTQHDV